MTTSLLVRAMRGESVERPPVWFMRQAGRSLPEYRAVREGTAMLDACFDTDMVVEITSQPVRRHGVDAAILFSDIVVPVKALGVDVEIKPGVGPVVAQPFRSRADLARLPDLTPDMVAPINAAVTRLTDELDVPVIGFAGAPFTVASYLVEGGPSRDLPRTKALMFEDPVLFGDLMERLAAVAGASLSNQVDAGASAVQVFDSWVGALSEAQYRTHVLPHSSAVFAQVKDLVPGIHFAVGAGHLSTAMSQAGCAVLGVDFRTPLDAVAEPIRTSMPLQGNLDPTVLLCSHDVIEREVARVLDSARGLVGHIFNLGHGVLPDTPADNVTYAVQCVQRLDRRS